MKHEIVTRALDWKVPEKPNVRLDGFYCFVACSVAFGRGEHDSRRFRRTS